MPAEGAFAASLDADSEGVEGKFYVWTRDEILLLLGEDAAFFGAHYDLPAHGNWEERIILERISPVADAATEIKLLRCRDKLFLARAKRIRPGRDDKILADWNALTIAALARAAAVFAQAEWLELAARSFDFILDAMAQPDGRIAHARRAGRISASGLLEDQASMIRAALALYEATGAAERLAQALRILAAAEQNFSDGAGAFFTTASDAGDLPAGAEFRSRNVMDGPTPSGIGLMAENYARLYHLTGDDACRAKAEAVLAAFGGQKAALVGSPVLLAAADMLANASCVVITGFGDKTSLHQAALAAPDPAVCVLLAPDEAALPQSHPAHGKTSSEPAAFVCQGNACALPVSTPEALGALLRQIAKN
jgi:uncharacterized protein YyaL (SSP411 family)